MCMTIDQQRHIIESVARGELSTEEADALLVALDSLRTEAARSESVDSGRMPYDSVREAPTERLDRSDLAATRRLDAPQDAADYAAEATAGAADLAAAAAEAAAGAVEDAAGAAEAAEDAAAAAEDAVSAAASSRDRYAARGDSAFPAIRVSLSGGGVTEVEGDPAARGVRLIGPHAAVIDDSGPDIVVVGDVGTEGLLVVPAAADLDLEINSAGAEVRGLQGTLHGVFNVGDLYVDGEFTRGESVIDANAGTVYVTLAPTSDVVVVVRAACSIDAGDGLEHTGRGEWTLGGGTASLEISGNLGTIVLRRG